MLQCLERKTRPIHERTCRLSSTACKCASILVTGGEFSASTRPWHITTSRGVRCWLADTACKRGKPRGTYGADAKVH